LSLADDVLARARAALLNSPINSSPFKVMPAELPVPVPRHGASESGSRTGKSRIADKFVVRMPDDMRDRMARFANLHKRSCNSECIMAMEWWMDRQSLMWAMLQATDHELARLEQLRSGEEQKALDAIAQRLPDAAALVAQLKALIEQG